jgi:hypothetical protein
MLTYAGVCWQEEEPAMPLHLVPGNTTGDAFLDEGKSQVSLLY